MYLVSVGPQTHEYGTREQAIAAAKEFSSESRSPVIVFDEQELERFSYHRGHLESYAYDPRGPRG